MRFAWANALAHQRESLGAAQVMIKTINAARGLRRNPHGESEEMTATQSSFT